jgi:predicted deacylase
MQEIVSNCTHGIDLHTGGRHRSNFPQIRAELSDPTVRAMTEAFGAPLVINSAVRDGSLRQCATELGVPVILYESCEALRFDEVHIRAGVKGVVNVMRHLGMLRKSRAKLRRQPIFSRQTAWLRAPASGIHRMLVPLGAQVSQEQVIGLIADPLGIEETEVRAPSAGVIIGRSNLPLVYAGDALFHIADIHNEAAFAAESFHEELMPSDYKPTEDDPSTAPIAL